MLRLVCLSIATLMMPAAACADQKVPLPAPRPKIELLAKAPLPVPRPKVETPAAQKIPLPRPKPVQEAAAPVAPQDKLEPRLYACPKRERIDGSCPNVIRAFRISQEHNYTPLQDKEQVEKFLERGLIKEVVETDVLKLRHAGHPYVRPALFIFLERFSKEYSAKCGEPLVVTSLVRPKDKQPRNASKYSVHPMGMAADLSVHHNACREWIEKTLLELEAKDVLDVTRERKPPHYHVVVFPTQYEAYLKAQAVAKK